MSGSKIYDDDGAALDYLWWWPTLAGCVYYMFLKAKEKFC